MRRPKPPETGIADTLELWCVASDGVFCATPRRLVLQGLGGLLDMAREGRSPHSAYLIAVYDNQTDANAHAARLGIETQEATQ